MSVDGHTDNQGKKEANLVLSQRRATAVVKYLVAHGVEASRLRARGFGDTKPLVLNLTKRSRAKNRRVEFLIYDDDPARGPQTGGASKPSGGP